MGTENEKRPRNYWMHRITHHCEVSHPLTERGLLSIGWSGLSTPENIEKITADNNGIHKVYEENKWEPKRSRYSLRRFVREMKKGDRVIVPHWENCSIYEILEDAPLSIEQLTDKDLADLCTWDDNPDPVIRKSNRYLFNGKENKIIDLGFFRRVKPLKENIPRYFANEDLRRKMRWLGTTLKVTDVADSFEDTRRRTKLTIIKESVTSSITKKTYEIFKNHMDDTLFEKLVCWYFKAIGATDVEKLSADDADDTDISAAFEPIKTIIYTQAKFQDDKINEWAIEQITDFSDNRKELLNDYTINLWVISFAPKFSDACIRMAREKQVVLVNGYKFIEMILGAGLDGLENI